VNERISKLKHELKDVSQARKLKRKKRQENRIPTVSIVGYTNAGKSTLLNALTDAHQETKDGLFTTLDPLSRQYVFPNHQKVIFSDTVGFMHHLPHKLIEAFKATLEEVVEADLLLHVVDVSHPKFRDYHDSVIEVLKELGAEDKKTITVFNKIDKIEQQTGLQDLADSFENAVFISAKTKEHVDSLVEKVQELIAGTMIEINVDIPLNRMDLVNLIHKEGTMHTIEYLSDKIHLSASVPPKIVNKFK
jgi:GTP-binding protein HflX